MPQPYTHEAVKQLADEHFQALLERPYLMRLTAEQAAASVAISRKTLDEALATRVGDQCLLSKVLDWPAASDFERQQLLGSLPFIIGCLGVLKMEFTHEKIGVLPPDVVRPLLETATSVVHQGICLTADTVHIHYRRLALAP